jgi:MurNAc alpha-1-phosphate uridylyltransferase
VSIPVPKRAMVLAAGLGLRLRPITTLKPKPLVEVGGQTLLDRALDRLADAGVDTAVVNTHYFAEMVAKRMALRTRPRIILSPETDLLETGGGIARALDKLNPPGESEQPFYAVNGDSFWLNGPSDIFKRLAAAWDDARMDALLAVYATPHALGYDGQGDFMMDEQGRLRRRAEDEVVPFAFIGLQILHPRLFCNPATGTVESGAFSLNRLYDRAAATGRLWGVAHDGEWFHISTPDDLREADARLGTKSSFYPRI